MVLKICVYKVQSVETEKKKESNQLKQCNIAGTMGDDIRAPVLWRRPNAKTYAYNQEFGGNYYQVSKTKINTIKPD